MQAHVTAADDANPRDDRAVDRTRVLRRRARRLTRPESDRILANNLRYMQTVRAPIVRGAPRKSSPSSRYGWVCRVSGR